MGHAKNKADGVDDCFDFSGVLCRAMTHFVLQLKFIHIRRASQKGFADV